MSEREFDLVLHGATGFVGRLTAAHLAAHAAGEARPLRLALSGRSAGRLAALRDELADGPAGALPTVVTDSGDDASVADLAARSAVVVSTVGPYARHGLPLVLACAEHGTSYADLTGEVQFARASVDGADARARATGARIVHSAGFDSVPSDLGVLLLHEQAQGDGEGTLTDTVLVLVDARGGFSGGTVDSLRGQIDAVRNDRAVRRLVADPFALDPERAARRSPAGHRDVLLPTRDPLLGRWVAPFVMGPYNTRIVRRSNALLGNAYGPQFRYREVMAVGGGVLAPLAAGAVSAALGALAGGLALPPTRAVLDRVLPRPGTGPSERTREHGRFRVEVHTRTTTGARYVATVAASGDPGYQATSVMLGQSGLSLAVDPLTSPGGVLTPAVALGDALVARLRARGFELAVRRED